MRADYHMHLFFGSEVSYRIMYGILPLHVDGDGVDDLHQNRHREMEQGRVSQDEKRNLQYPKSEKAIEAVPV